MFYAKEGLIDEQMEKILYCISCQLCAVIRMALHNGINRIIRFCCYVVLLMVNFLTNCETKFNMLLFVPHISEALFLILKSPRRGIQP